jgi:chorismate mutase
MLLSILDCRPLPIRRNFRMSDQALIHHSGCPENIPSGAQADRLVDLVVQRLTLAQDVAAAKYDSGVPIDDPVRELEILESAAHALKARGPRQRIVIQFFRDQIEANKVIQRELHQRWRRHPEESPAANPDVVAELRLKLDKITGQLTRLFNSMSKFPQYTHGHLAELIDERFSAMAPGQQLPKMHRDAALFAMRAFCTDASARIGLSGP